MNLTFADKEESRRASFKHTPRSHDCGFDSLRLIYSGLPVWLVTE